MRHRRYEIREAYRRLGIVLKYFVNIFSGGPYRSIAPSFYSELLETRNAQWTM